MLQKRIAIGLFSNLQGLEIGARCAGFDVPLSSDIDEKAKELAPVIWGNNREEIYLVKDVKEVSFERDIKQAMNNIGMLLEPGEIDLLLGGPPCFGITGLNAKFRSVFHELNFLMIEMLRLVGEMQPKVALMEQVPLLLSRQMRPFLNYLIDEIESLGNYYWAVKTLNAENFGCFQSRKRTMIMLVRKDLGVLPSYPFGHAVDLGKQSVYATINAEFIRDNGFKKHSLGKPRVINGREKLFPTLTSGNVEIYRDGLWQQLTIKDRKILAHMEQYDFSNMISDAALTKKLGMMVLPPFSEALCRHIHNQILDNAAA